MAKLKGSVSSEYHCKLCPFKSLNSQLFKDHVSYIHARIKDYVCNECGKAFASKVTLGIHAKAFHPNRTVEMDAKLKHKCEICSKEFDTQELLGHHNKGHLYHHCPHCDYSSAFSSCLSRHIKREHFKPSVPKQEFVKRVQPNMCPACDYSTSRSQGVLNSHIRLCHLPKKTFSCDQCSYSAKLKHHMAKHKRNVHHKEGRDQVVCLSCKRSFRDTSNYVRHVRSVHLQVRRHRCEDCGKEFTRRHSFRRHLKEAKGCKKQREIVVKS